MQIDGEQGGAALALDWQTSYLEFLLHGELSLGKVEGRRLARRAKTFILLGDEKGLYRHNPLEILQWCIPISQGQELLGDIHSEACGHQTRHLGPSLEMPSNKGFTGQPRLPKLL
jgi:hypothetical protein